MAIHRLSDRAEMLMRLMLKPGEKPADFLHNLVCDYHAGLSFDVAVVEFPLRREEK